MSVMHPASTRPVCRSPARDCMIVQWFLAYRTCGRTKKGPGGTRAWPTRAGGGGGHEPVAQPLPHPASIAFPFRSPVLHHRRGGARRQSRDGRRVGHHSRAGCAGRSLARAVHPRAPRSQIDRLVPGALRTGPYVPLSHRGDPGGWAKDGAEREGEFTIDPIMVTPNPAPGTARQCCTYGTSAPNRRLSPRGSVSEAAGPHSRARRVRRDQRPPSARPWA